ncbi:MAG: hypothetical protein GXO58_04160, partial [Thermodesulfobacteria bacterium]|nr:hypothetical protein [Thermodesulfobacteriota bacterium]
EFKSMIYMGVINGITGFQTWPMRPSSQILWESVKNSISEMREIWPFIISQKKVDLSIEGSQYMYASAKLVGDKLYIVAVNPSNLKQQASFKIETKDAVNSTGQILFENKECKMINNKVDGSFEPYERHVYVIPLNDSVIDEINETTNDSANNLLAAPNNIEAIIETNE